MKIDAPTYLISELSGVAVQFVTAMREKYNPERVAWPVDITIAGSSGVGTISEEQDLEEVIKQLAPIIRETYFTEVKFENIQSFPSTGIYFLHPERDLFDRMHKAVVSSGVIFNENAFPYTPHCTLRDGPPMDTNYEFEKMDFPPAATIQCFSLYQPRPYGGKRIHIFKPDSKEDGT